MSYGWVRDDSLLEVGWVPEGFALRDPPGLFIHEAAFTSIVAGSADGADPPEVRCWARAATFARVVETGYHPIRLHWYVRDWLGPVAETMLAGLTGARVLPSADGAGKVYVEPIHGCYVDDTSVVEVWFDDSVAEQDIERMMRSIRIP